MSIGLNALKRRERDVVVRCSRDSFLKDVLWSKGGILDVASHVTYQELFWFLVLLTLALVLWLISRKQLSPTRQTEGEGEKDTDAHVTSKIPPGSSGWPLVGETIEFVLDGRKFFRTRRAKYGSVFRSHLCGLPTVVIVGAENVQKVLTATESSLVQSPPSSFLKLFGRGALSSTVGHRHSQLQRSIIRLFTPRNLSLFVTPVQKVIREQVARWRDAGSVVNGSDACREMSLSVVYQCLFGFDLDRSEATGITELFQTFSDGVFAFPVRLPGFAFHKAMEARDALRSLVAQRNPSSFSSSSSSPSSSSSASSSTDEWKRRGLSMLDILQSMGVDDQGDVGGDKNADVPDLVLELLFGANESTASAMCTALVELSEHLSVLDKIRCELRQLDLAPGDPIDYETIRRLAYTSDVVKEVLRVQPPIAGAFRRTCKPFPIQDYVIPAGWMVLYGITDTHETSSAFDEVEKFNPDRWMNVKLGRTMTEQNREATSQKHLEGQGTDQTAAQTTEQRQTTEQKQTTEQTVRNINKYEYIPFGGGGKRFCVGEALARMVLSVFLIELASGTNGWTLINGRPEIKTAPIPFPKDHLPILFNSPHGLRSTGAS